MREDYVKRYEKTLLKWRAYRKLRSISPELCTVGHPAFLTWHQREVMFEDMLNIIEFSKDD